MSLELEKIILTLMLNDNEFSSKVFPYFKTDYFLDTAHSTVATIFKKYQEKYNALPSLGAMEIELSEQKNLSQQTYSDAQSLIHRLYNPEIVCHAKELSKEHILEKTEKYFKQQSCMLAVYKAIDILENKSASYDNIPELLKDAVSVSFDQNIGHDYIRDAQERFNEYHKVESLLPFKLTALNMVTGGGCGYKSLVVPVAPTGVGKSFFMTDWASYLIKNGYNVLYVTLELSETKIAERIDMNLMDCTLQQLRQMPLMTYNSKINQIKSNAIGTIKIKEYVAGVFNANHLRHLLKELKLKENFVPNIVFIDYINLMASYRNTDASNSYAQIKAVAEEVRGVAMEQDLIVCSPTQTNRSGVNASDFNLTEISESLGIAMTADFIFGLIQTDDMADNHQMKVKQLKNRWGDINRPSSFMINVNKSKMQMSDGDDVSSYFKANTNQPKLEERDLILESVEQITTKHKNVLNFDE